MPASIVCENCNGLDFVFGTCRACGWRSPAQLAQDAKLRKGGVPKIAKALAEYGTRTPPVNVIETVGGGVVRADFKCPQCKGRGWTLNACNACDLCFGRGTVSGIRRTLYRQRR